MIELVDGDIFKAATEVLVNPVNTLGISGKGLALAFRQKFPENFKAYEQVARNGKLQPGRVFVYDYRLRRNANPRYIFNLPTKEHWKDPSQLSWVEDGIYSLVWETDRLKVGSIAIPALGCGLGGLDWNSVYPILEKAFSSMPKVLAKVFPPK